MILYIVRHGNTFDLSDVVTRVGGRTDISLSKSGRVQVDVLSEAFKNILVDQCYASPLKRTMQTAQAICSVKSITIQPAEFLREIDYGPDENKVESDVIKRIGMQAIRDWDEKSIVPKGWNIDPDFYIKAWRDFCSNINVSSTIVVTSNGIARFLLDALFLNASPVLQGKTRKLKTGSVGKLVKKNEIWTLEYWGERPPLP